MNLADIIALAKEGYKPQDIKELISLADTSDDADDADVDSDADADVDSDADADADSDADDDADSDADADVDADADADASKIEMEQLVNQLKKQNKNLQDALKRMDLSGDKKTESASDILKETLTSLF